MDMSVLPSRLISQSPPEISPGEIHVWRAHVQTPSEKTNLLRACLSPDELAIAQRYHEPQDQHRYEFRHGILRQLIALYLAQPAEKLSFAHNDFGKPSLASETELQFSLSHRRDEILLAFSRSMQVGVDIEFIDAQLDWSSTARNFFHPREQLQMNQLPINEQNALGYGIWTAKEAILKAVGIGITQHLINCQIPCPTPSSGTWIHLPPEVAASPIWLMPLELIPGYAAALAAYEKPAAVLNFSWP